MPTEMRVSQALATGNHAFLVFEELLPVLGDIDQRQPAYAE
jgi:hypothetical protein